MFQAQTIAAETLQEKLVAAKTLSSGIATVPRQGPGTRNRHTHRGQHGLRDRDWGPDAPRIMMREDLVPNPGSLSPPGIAA